MKTIGILLIGACLGILGGLLILNPNIFGKIQEATQGNSLKDEFVASYGKKSPKDLEVLGCIYDAVHSMYGDQGIRDWMAAKKETNATGKMSPSTTGLAFKVMPLVMACSGQKLPEPSNN